MCCPRMGVLDENTDLDDEPPLLELLLDDEPHALSASTAPTATAAVTARPVRLLVGMEPVLSFMSPHPFGSGIPCRTTDRLKNRG